MYFPPRSRPKNRRTGAAFLPEPLLPRRPNPAPSAAKANQQIRASGRNYSRQASGFAAKKVRISFKNVSNFAENSKSPFSGDFEFSAKLLAGWDVIRTELSRSL